MKRLMIGFLAAVFILAGCSMQPKVDLAFPHQAVKAAKDHGVAIAVYYFMGEDEYNRRYQEMQKRRPLQVQYLEQMAFLGKPEYTKSLYPTGQYAIAYLGAGGIIRDEHVLTVRHLFVHGENTVGCRIWVMQRDAMLPIEANVVAISAGKTNADDYALIKLTAPLGLPGLKIAPVEVGEGDPVVFAGTTGGLAFHTRYSRATRSSRYFRTDSAGYLHLSLWEDFEYLMTYPGGPGDSGGIVLNAKGELVGIMYCGLEVYAECYVFSNPIAMARAFLEANEKGALGQ